MAEDQHGHRVHQESQGLSATIKQDKRGQWLGFAVVLLAVCGAVYTAVIGASPWVSCALVGVPILGMVKAIIRPRD